MKEMLINAGFRYDHYSTFGGEFAPRAALIITPLNKSIFKLIYGESFRAPNAFEMYYTDVWNSYIINPSLKPEKAQTAEIVYEQYYGGHFRTSVSGFINRYKNLIDYRDMGNGQQQFQNVSKVELKGFEAESEARFNNMLQFRAGYTYTDGEDKTSGIDIDYSPVHLAKASIAFPIYRKFCQGAMEIQGIGRRKYIRIDGSGTPYNSATPGYAVSNATFLSREILDGLELSASVKNIFDKRIYDPSTPDILNDRIPQYGRTYYFQATYHF